MKYQVGDYAETYRTFRQDVPDTYNWAYQVFDEWGRDPRKVAMVWVGQDGASREVTFREMGGALQAHSQHPDRAGREAGRPSLHHAPASRRVVGNHAGLHES